MPHDFFFWSYLFDMKLPGEKNIPIGEHPYVVDLAAAPDGISPDNLAAIDEKDRVLPFAGIEH
jgi:hypothetical protein